MGETLEQVETLLRQAGTAAKGGQSDRALTLLKDATAIAPTDPRAFGALADLHRQGCRLDEALLAAERALNLDRRSVPALLRTAKVFYDRGELDQALRRYLAAAGLEPQSPEAHLGMGQILLAQGRFRPGWLEYEWRNRMPQARGMIPPVRAPMWNGMTLPSGRILLIGDQGYGDTFQFARYVPAVAAHCEEVMVACSEPVGALLGRLSGVGRVVQRRQDTPGFTAFALFSSLPFVFGTTLETIPASVPYLTPDPGKVTRWREWLEAHTPPSSLRVGLVWAGRPTHPNDHRRSLRLGELLPLLEVGGISFVSLQKDAPERDSPTLTQLGGRLLQPGELADFDETAALLSGLDLVISIDSGVAHLAAALAKPVWLLTPRPSDWRWLLEREDSPWYPTLRLFRQPRAGAWPEVVLAVREALQQLAASRVSR